jgi:hypothetical protein
MAMMMLFLYACADKNDLSGPTLEDVYAENRETNICDFLYCRGTPWQPKTLIINYLGCPFTVTFEWRQCAQAVETRNFDFSFDPTNLRCNTVKDSIVGFWLAGQSLQANNAYNALYKQLTLGVQNWVLSQLDQSQFNISTPVSFQFIETDCHTLCVFSELDFEGILTYSVSHVKCGESCCVRGGDIQFDVNGDAYIVNETLKGGSPCIATTVNCLGNYDQNSCTPACDRL